MTFCTTSILLQFGFFLCSLSFSVTLRNQPTISKKSTKRIDTIILTVIDDLGASDLGFTGSTIRTPVLDSIRNNGTLFTTYHVCRACSPTRASLLTSRYVTRYGLQSGVLQPNQPYGLFLNETLLPQRLSALKDGWTSHSIGKWHLGYFSYEYTPTFRGFDSYLGYYNGGGDYYSHVAYNGGFDLHYAPSPRCGANCTVERWDTQGHYSTHLFTRRAQTILTNSTRDEKLFIYLAYQAVHCPAEVPEVYKKGYNFSDPLRNTFAGMLTALDEGIGNLTDTLRETKRLETTLFIVTSDNGAPTPGCGGTQGGQNYPLRGGKCSAWSGGNLVPSFVMGPGILRGKTLDNLAHAVDWGVTILSFVNHSTDNPKSFLGSENDFFALDGVDHRLALQGIDSTPSRDYVLLEADPYSTGMPNPPGLSFPGDQHATPYYAIRDNRYKLMLGDPGQPGILDAWYCTGPPCPSDHNNTANASSVPHYNISSMQLYDLIDDPSETFNIVNSNPHIVAKLMSVLLQYNATAVSSAQQGMPNDPSADPQLRNNTACPWR